MRVKYTSTKLACYVGYVVQAVINNFLPILFIALQDIYGLGYEKLARLIIFNFAAQIVVDFISPRFINTLGYKNCAVISQFMAALGLASMFLLPQIMSNTYLAIIISIIIYAVGSGMMEVIISPIVEILPGDNKSGNMAFLHSFYCWGQAFTVVVTTILIFFFGFNRWNFVPLVWAVIPFINAIFFIKVPIIEPEKENKMDSFKDLVKSKRFVIYMLMMVCGGACEIAMAEWASMFAQKALGVSKTIGDITGPCAFAICMGAGRVWYSLVAKKIDFKKTVIVMSSLCFLCYITVAVCQIPFFALLACAICGFTVSLFWPGVLSEGAKEFKRGGAVLYSTFALCGDTGCSLGPWIVGIIADRTNLNFGFAAASVFPIIMILAAVLLIKNKDCKI